MAAEAEGEGFRLGRIKTSRLHTLQYTGCPKKKLLTEKAKKALEDKIAQRTSSKGGSNANNFGLSIL